MFVFEYFLGEVEMVLQWHLCVINKHVDTCTNKNIQTCQVICRPGAQLTGSAGVLIKHKLIFFTGSARPAAAHLTFTDHLEGAEDSQCLHIPLGRCFQWTGKLFVKIKANVHQSIYLYGAFVMQLTMRMKMSCQNLSTVNTQAMQFNTE